MMANVLASVLEFQRDMISENTRQGVAAPEASGKTLGRPTALDDGKAADVVTAYSQGTAVKTLAREHHVAPRTIRRVLDAAGDDTIQHALATGRTIRRGQGRTVRLTAPLELHNAALRQSSALAADAASPAERKAHRIYATRIRTANGGNSA